ncbi:MAG: type IV secretion system protein TraC [Rickettsiales bacterium]|jgi:conjugal transfer ATP-binding protein TraC|nr:type IV secretion system protein TraC [Rickettsiales bacterium]
MSDKNNLLNSVFTKINNLFSIRTLEREQEGNNNNRYRFENATISSLLPYRVYDDKNNIYFNENSISFIMELNPIVGGDDETSNILTQLITDGLPENCYVSFMSWASPNVESILDIWSKPRIQNGEIYAKQGVERKKFFLNGVKKSLFNNMPYTIKDFRCFISATIPFSHSNKNNRLEKLCSFRRALIGSLKNIGLYSSEIFTPSQFIHLLGEILNPISSPNYENYTYQTHEPINTQISSAENSLRLERDQIVFEKDNVVAKCFSIKSYPRMWSQGQCANLIGSITNDQLRMEMPFLTCFNFFIENEEKKNTKSKIKQTRVTQQESTQLVKFMPQLHEQKADWDFVLDKINSGQKLATCSYSIIVFAPQEKISQAEQTLKSLYKNNEFILQLDRYIQLPTFLSCLPFIIGDGLHKDYYNRLEKGKTMVSWTCANLLPVQGEWKGMRSPILQLIGRRGQPFYWDPFENKEGNYNTVVVGKSGSGKSVFMQELVSSLRGGGARVYVIDDGRSFMNTCLLQGGRFILFSGDQNVCLNPFSFIKDSFFTDREEKVETVGLLVNIVKAMCFSIRDANEFESASIEESVTHVIEKKGKKSTITDIREYLDAKKDIRLKDLATMLSPFSKGGKYEAYFDGECNLDIDNDFISFEMAELKNKQDLRSIVLLILMFIISNKMYYGDRKQKTALIIDEAWDLLHGGGSVGKFIEGFARRCRKYGGALVTGTQSINDYFKNSGAKAALENSDWMCLLAQKKESIEDFDKTGKIIMTDAMKEMLKSIRMSDKQYSEVMIYGPSLTVIGRLILDKFSLAMYSSKAEDVVKIKDLQKSGKTLVEAVEIVAGVAND